VEFFIGAFAGFRARSIVSAVLRAALAFLFLIALDQLILSRLELDALEPTLDLWLTSGLLILAGAVLSYLGARRLRHAAQGRNTAS
jgi:hypothetical protein